MDAASVNIPPASSVAELSELLRAVASANHELLSSTVAATAIVMQARTGSLESNLGQQLDITV